LTLLEKQTAPIETHSVSILKHPVRLSQYLPGVFTTITTKSGIKKAIKKGLVQINGEIGYTADFISGGELIELFREQNLATKPIIKLPIEVLFEDDYLAIVNKPAGIVVSGNKKITLENALPNNLKVSEQPDALHRPEPIHRLDYATSGALLIGKTSSTVIALNKLFEERKIEKKYLAVTIREMSKEGIVSSSIENKPSKSTFHVLRSLDSPKYERLNLVELCPHTGRRNQLRIHMAEMGNPILGDQKFGEEGFILKGKGLYLHAYAFKFAHPHTKQHIVVKAAIPRKILKLFPKIIDSDSSSFET
jgi:23S rRNA pseudouridine1911/1915/1917 synthase